MAHHTAVFGPLARAVASGTTARQGVAAGRGARPAAVAPARRRAPV
ncbi:hypothetical protein LO772_34395 [Yinghuangia sp. ASG 101]|nr:hypothetical protein [Yinghuangia sp. ASG 101]UGQ11802.1 hypothetical protein LO772_34395 [Yinghuangia sp. ASG 101]